MIHGLLNEMMREFRALDCSLLRLRKFGLLVGGIFVLSALVLAWHTLSVYVYVAAFVGILLVLCALFAPAALAIPYRGWMALALVLGFVVGNIVLVAMYLVLLTPIGLLQRLFGGDVLNRRYDSNVRTYWMKHPVSQEGHMRRPF
jgi:hypothetical protein